jgi:hypothetical protein
MQRIHLFDVVTSSDLSMENRMFTVVGMLRVGTVEVFEGLWLLKDICTQEEIECLGSYITVWKPYSFPKKVKIETKQDNL